MNTQEIEDKCKQYGVDVYEVLAGHIEISEAYQIIDTFYTHHNIDKKDLDSKFVEWWRNCLVSENE